MGDPSIQYQALRKARRAVRLPSGFVIGLIIGVIQLKSGPAEGWKFLAFFMLGGLYHEITEHIATRMVRRGNPPD